MSSAATLPEPPPGTAETIPDELELRVFAYRDEGEWVALALEMDLRGYGETCAAALEELRELVLMQLTFAVGKRAPGLIWKEAEPVWFARWESSNRERLLAIAARRPRDLDESATTTLRISEDALVRRFKLPSGVL